MIQKENNTVNTGQAWHKLYARLEQDYLLPGEAVKKPFRFSRPMIGWAVAITALCISAATVLFLRDNDSNVNSNLLTLHNEKGSATLVTTLEDGSIVYLSGDTRLQYPEHFAEEKREVKLEGNALFDVAGNRERPFLIETELIRIEVVGTSFNVQSTGHIPFELSVQRGEVKVTYKKSGESLRVKAGEKVTLASNRLRLEQVQNDEIFAGYCKKIRFKDEKLGDILRVINKKSTNITLQVTPSLENRQLTVTFDNESPETMARLICIAFNLTCTIDNNVLLISEP
ncbi:MAG: FecR domain-containing protein [Tannerellaceae bacterium]|jgi:ferric-dicitrate binding protein FerR (iron transport regulator)|nr:FecR domain-containing protein [Tannerellaceae bacterium]